MSLVHDNTTQVLKRILVASGLRNPSEVHLVAVAKEKSVEQIREYLATGQTHVGENYVQEFLEKWEALKGHGVHWHFVGHVQRRKAKDLVGRVDLIHSLDSIQLAYEINRHASRLSLQQACLVQINLSGEPTKSGLGENEICPFFEELKKFKLLKVRGLMTLPPNFETPEKARPIFKRLREWATQLHLSELSMGMSGDFEIAIEEGATLVRIGQAIFGERS